MLKLLLASTEVFDVFRILSGDWWEDTLMESRSIAQPPS
jgi:hypothetical protein